MTLRWAILVLLAAGCSPTDPGTRFNDNDDDELDLVAPSLTHEHDPSPRTFEETVYIGADVEDDSEVFDVTIVFQRETDGKEWTKLRMAPLTDTYYEGTIPGREVTSGGIRYYIVATDEFENTACLPDACAAEAWHFPVVPPRD
ncbi:MAG: hypothetical protein AB8H79_15345 [Myxococcota bacterium]